MTVSKPDVVQTLEHARAELFALVDECTSTFNEYENEKSRGPDADKVLKDMRGLQRSSLNSLHTVQAIIETLDAKMKGFAERIEQFGDHVSRKALNYGLDLIPDDVLSEIFFFAAETMEEKVGLSLMCRRFRTVMMSTRRMWDGHYLEIGQSPEQMVAIAEGNRFISLKAVIRGHDEVRSSASYKAWARNGGPDPREFVDRFYKRSLDFVLQLRLEELHIPYLCKDEDEEVAQRILDSVAMQSVRTLVMRYCPNPVLRSFERRHTPSLRNLDVHFVPGPTVGRDLIRCKLSDFNHRELNSLREFLASANVLQYLLLHLCGDWSFYEAYDLPSLRSLEVDFIPHPSFASHLTRFTFSWRVHLTLAELLDFLSSTEVLQALSIYKNGEFDVLDAPDALSVDSLRVVTLPYLASCEIHHGFFRVGCPSLVPALTSKLCMPNLRRLELRFKFDVVGFHKLTEVFDIHLPDNFIVHQGRLIHFEVCSGLTPAFVNTIARHLADTEEMQIKFGGCRGWRNGTFRLDELDAAWL